MDKINHNSILFSLILLIIVLIEGCGGGGGSNPTESSDQNNPLIPEILNPGLSGHLFFAETYRYSTTGTKVRPWRMDIATGRYKDIPNTNWYEQEQRFPLAATSNIFLTPVDYSDSEFVIAAQNCKFPPDGVLSPDTVTCILIQDMNGNYLEEFDLLYEVAGVNMSRDRQYLALYRRLGSDITADVWFEIYDRKGTLISRDKNVDKSNFKRIFSWLPSGRIVYAIRRTLYYTEPNSTTPEYTKTLPDNLQGEIVDIAISPDGAQLVFTIETIQGEFARETEPFIMNVDGSNIRKLAMGPPFDTPRTTAKISRPRWSPDGRWILVRAGEFVTVTPGTPFSQPSITATHSAAFYVLPTEDMGKVFVLTPEDSLRSAEVRMLSHQREISLKEQTLTTEAGDIFGDWQP